MRRILWMGAFALLALAPIFALADTAGETADIVVIDPGHGGKNPGARVRGRVEKEIVLDISEDIADRLRRGKTLTPYLTRWDDTFVPLSDRVLRGEAAGGDAFISIHADNVRRVRNRGVVVFVYGRNHTIPDGPRREPGEKILPPPTKAARRASIRLAERIRRSLKTHGIKTAPYVDKGRFAVLKSRKMPSVLIEVGNLRDPKEAKLLESPRFKKKFAKAVEEAVSSFLRSESRRAKR
jgi:N-acetylmuramoyl-L-alanine amidase